MFGGVVDPTFLALDERNNNGMGVECGCGWPTVCELNVPGMLLLHAGLISCPCSRQSFEEPAVGLTSSLKTGGAPIVLLGCVKYTAAGC